MAKPNQSSYQDLLDRARKRFRQAVAAEQEIRAEAMIDLDFLAGNQWDPKVKREREREPSPRPCLVFNKCLPPVTQLGNQARQNKPALVVSPVDSAGDPDTAKVMGGMIRHIEYDSDAEVAYDTALFYAAGCSFGYWMYGCEYSDPETFDQDLKVITIDDPFSIYLDCYAAKPDKSDMKWAFRISRMANDAHEAKYGPDRADLSLDFDKQLSEEGWTSDEDKQVAEYWEVQTVEKTLRLRKDEDGTVHKVYLEDLDEEEQAASETWDWVVDQTGKVRERTVEIPQVMQYIINGAEVLEEPTPWDGTTIPIVKVTGLEVTVRGKKKIFSMTRFARDPQQLLNFYKTMEAETISLAPKPKWVGFVGQFKTKRRDWQRANTDNAAFLEADMVAVGDKPAPLPHWETFDPPVQSLNIGSMSSADDIKSATGYYDPSLGLNKSDQSGVAIKSLQRQGDVSNFHFVDNLSRAMKRGGRILLELIPRKYDTAREVRIIGEDQKESIAKVNGPYVDDNGRAFHHKLDVGKYDCRPQQGPSYTTQRIETRELIMQLAQGNPEVWQLAGDIFFENQDFVGADRLARRFKKALPPALQDENDDPNVPPELQAKMSQMQTQNEQLSQQNQQLLQMVKGKLIEAQARAESAERINREKIESAERIANENNRTRVQTAETLSKNDSMNQLAELDHKAVEHQLDLRAALLHDTMTVEADLAQQDKDHQHQKDLADQQQQAAAESQESDQQNSQDMAKQAQDAQAAQAAQKPAVPPQGGGE